MVLFPLKNLPTQSYKDGQRKFGARRKNGRLHAGCDLYAPVGTPIFAMQDGEVIQDAYGFYLGTKAVEIKHLDFVARYGEISGVAEGIRKGAKIKKGQLIAYIGKLKGLNMSMLHLELYAGTGKGALTVVKNKPYQRRKDLIDPTPILDMATVLAGVVYDNVRGKCLSLDYALAKNPAVTMAKGNPFPWNQGVSDDIAELFSKSRR